MMAIENNDEDEDFLYFGEISTYDGQTMSGKGIRAWIKGDSPAILIGWFKNGAFTGYGRNIFEKSTVYYEGEFYNYKQHGKGAILFPDGDVYMGSFKNGKRDGYGKCCYGNGRIYTGEWKDGKPHGKGMMKFTIEEYVREGEWKDGRMEGMQTVTYLKTGEVRVQQWECFKLVKDEQRK